MKNSTIYLALALISISILTSCKKNKSEDEVLNLGVTPTGTFLTVTSGEFKNFTLSGSSPSKLTRLKITYRKEGQALNTLLDSTLETSKINFTYTFIIPNYGIQDIYLNLFFELTDETGASVTVAKGITVAYPNHILTRIADNELYSRLSGQYSTYNLRTAYSIPYSLPYTEDMNISDTLQADSLSRSWISPAGGLFVRKNSFNFDNATINDLKNGFEGSAKTTKISNLMIGDIILYKQTYNEEIFYAALKITDIQNNTGSSNDKYIFDIKK